MKFISALAAPAAFVLTTAPAQAEAVHEASIEHNGQTITLSYEPKVETTLRQAGIGPRSVATCFWKSRISVQRVARDASGEPIPALTGTVEETRPRGGMRTGLCNMMKINRSMAFGGDDAALRAFVADAAGSDATAIRGLLEGTSAGKRVR